MSKIALAVMLVGFCAAGRAMAAPGELTVTLYADHAVAYLDPSSGEAHAFMCLAPSDAPAAKPDCFGFYPRGETITSIQMSNGGGLDKAGTSWTETPGGFRFTQAVGPADNVVLRDASRGLSWTLSIPRGGSLTTANGKTASWYHVAKVTFPAQAKGFIGSDWAGSDFQELPQPWIDAELKYSKVIDARRRTDLTSIINNWNGRALPLTQANMVDFIDATAATIGAHRPRRSPGQSAADYVQALIQANP